MSANTDGMRVVSVGPIELNITSPLSISTIDPFSDATSPLSIVLNASANELFMDGVLAYKMKKGTDCTFSEIQALPVITASNTSLKNTFLASSSILTCKHGHINYALSEPTLLSDFSRCSFDYFSDQNVKYIFMNSIGELVDVYNDIHLLNRVYVAKTDEYYEGSLTPPEGHLWYKVISPNVKNTNLPYVHAYDATNEQYIWGDTDNQSLELIDITINSQLHMITYQSPILPDGTIELPIRLQTNLPTNNGLEIIPLYHKDLKFVKSVDLNGINVLWPPSLPIQLEYDSNPYIYHFPVTRLQAIESVNEHKDACHRLLEVFANVLLRNLNASNDYSIGEIFTNIESLKEQLAHLLSNTIINTINTTDLTVFNSLLSNIYNREGPTRFSFSEAPSNFKINDIFINFNIACTLRISNKKALYTIKDIGVVLRVHD